MFREMRRKRQLLPHEESVAILKKMTNGVLALHGDDGYPYAVPVSYVYADGKIYFHSAPQGHKTDAITRDGKVSFCVVERDEIVPAEFTTYFRKILPRRARTASRNRERIQSPGGGGDYRRAYSRQGSDRTRRPQKGIIFPPCGQIWEN